MEMKKVAFCCPHHGVLHASVEYLSVNMGAQKLVDISVMYCQACRKYYTPFSNLLAIAKIKHKGRPVAASQGRVERSVPRETVRAPHFVSIEEESKQNDRLRKGERRYIRGYEVVPIHDVNPQSLGHTTILTNYVCDKCLVCGSPIVKFNSAIQISDTEVIIVPGLYCTNCDTFYESRGTALKTVSKDISFSDNSKINTDYLIPQYAQRVKNVQSILSASFAVHLRSKNTREHRLVSIVSVRSDRNFEMDVYHYSDWFARRLLLEIARQNKTISMAGDELEILKILRMDWKHDFLLDRLKVDTIVLRKGGGLYGGITQHGTELVDILLYSPFTGCFEVAHSTFDTENAIYYMDAKVFRSFVLKYGNPGIKIAAYQRGLVDFSTMQEESVLHAYGYVVGNNGVSDRERHNLLGEVMDLGVMSASSILNLLDLNITMHPGEKYENARFDWELDKQFVAEYKVNPDRFVVATLGF